MKNVFVTRIILEFVTKRELFTKIYFLNKAGR